MITSNLQVGKCYKTKGKVITAMFKVKRIDYHNKPFSGLLNAVYYTLKASRGFLIESDRVVKFRYRDLFPFDEFVEIDEKDLDKLEHAHNGMVAVFNAVINKYQ